MLVGYGCAVIAGPSSSFMINKLVTVRNLALYIFHECVDDLGHLKIIINDCSFNFLQIIGHSILALILWIQSKKVDLDNFESTFGFYMLIWKASD